MKTFSFSNPYCSQIHISLEFVISRGVHTHKFAGRAHSQFCGVCTLTSLRGVYTHKFERRAPHLQVCGACTLTSLRGVYTHKFERRATNSQVCGACTLTSLRGVYTHKFARRAPHSQVCGACTLTSSQRGGEGNHIIAEIFIDSKWMIFSFLIQEIA